MTDRRKLRARRRSWFDISDKLKRREITSPTEKANVASELRDKIQLHQEEKTREAEKLAAARDLAEQDAKECALGDNWRPPASPVELARSIAFLHPDWDIDTTAKTAVKMWERYSLVRAAMIAGMKNGRQLREQVQHGKGWWFEEMQPLTPAERGHVMDTLRGILFK